MYALIGFNDNPYNVRVLTIGISPIILKEWLSRPSMYWWNRESDETTKPPKLNWRYPDEGHMEALFCGDIFGKPVTKLQIVKIEAYGI